MSERVLKSDQGGPPNGVVHYPNWSSGGTADSLVVARLARSNESAARFLTNPVISAERPVLWRRQTKSSSYAGLSRTGGLFARGFAA